MRIGIASCVVAAFLLTDASVALAQQAPRAAPPATAGQAEIAVKTRRNAATVGIATGQLDAAYPRLAQDLAKVLDDGDNLRILPILTYGSVGNVEDLLYLKNVDIAFTKSDSFEYFSSKLKINLTGRINYIARLFDAEMHILVRPEIKSLADLQGKKINLGSKGNAANVTGPILMQKLGIKFEPLFIEQTAAIEMMKKGEIDAVMRVAGKPADTFTKIAADSGFVFLPISPSEFAQHFSELYVLGRLTSADYPNLIKPGETISTIAVPDILVAYNWRANPDRATRVQRFTEAFFTNFDKLLQPPYHPKWKDVNLAATLPGQVRLEAADRMLRQLATSRTGTLRKDFVRFLDSQGSNSAGLTPEQREALFQQFVTWSSGQQR